MEKTIYLNIFGKLGRGVHTNLCQYNLARLEISRKPLSEFLGDESIPLTRQLIARSRDEDLPGILGQFLMLEAQYEFEHGDHTEALENINEARKLSLEPGLGFLKESIRILLNQMNA
ncbi:MAG: hypothetical protein ACFFDQ_10505 [Candidatus Thorarchaeota archaeon]